MISSPPPPCHPKGFFSSLPFTERAFHCFWLSTERQHQAHEEEEEKRSKQYVAAEQFFEIEVLGAISLGFHEMLRFPPLVLLLLIYFYHVIVIVHVAAEVKVV
jgi:hypothetical protein